ncbi:MAG: helix-turn-helix domain-containing protein [Planctomycetes bacterium]|nr:helix-turn-helix domain-containing protein [Planctomycetota bacterium]
MAETMDKPAIFVADKHLKTVFQNAFAGSGLRPGRGGWRYIVSWGDSVTSATGTILAAWSVEDITREALKDFRRRYVVPRRPTVYYVLFGRGLPSRAVVDRVAWLQVKDDQRILLAPAGEGEEDFARRLLTALDKADDSRRILDAWWEESTFVVVSATREGFRKSRVPIEKLPVLRRIRKRQREEFEIDEDGTFIHWPGGDIHLGWEQFEHAVDATARLKAKQQVEGFNRAYGAAIEAVRKEKGLRQSDVAGLTPRQVGRIEHGQCRATLSALAKLAKAHDVSVNEYMEELSKHL